MYCADGCERGERLGRSRINFDKLLQERINKVNPCRKLTAEEVKRLKKLETIADKLKRGENVENRQLHT
jgi:hypothetical protein